MSLALKYLESVRKTFDSYKTLGEKAMAQMTVGEINYAVNEDSNSVALIVKHLHGNMLSRWTDFLTTDGEKPWRKRDEEFEGITETMDEVMKTWQAGWQCLFDALSALNENDLDKTVSIRDEKQSVLEAINRQLAHYSYHVGQIVFIAKEKRGADWVSLTIPRRKSR